MLEKLRNREIGISLHRNPRVLMNLDVAIGLTEGWVAGIVRGEPVRIIGSYVKSPLRKICSKQVSHSEGWAISAGPGSRYNEISDLKGSTLAISRIGRYNPNQ